MLGHHLEDQMGMNAILPTNLSRHIVCSDTVIEEETMVSWLLAGVAGEFSMFL